MQKDINKLFGDIRGLLSELANIDKNIGINKTLVLKEMSQIVSDYNPTYQEWCDIKFYMVQVLAVSFGDSHHLGCTGLLSEIFGQAVRRGSLDCDINYNQDMTGAYENLNRTFRIKSSFTLLEDYGIHLSLNIISILQDLINLTYDIRDPLRLRLDPENKNTIDFGKCDYIVDGGDGRDITLQIMRNLSKNYCKTKTNDELIEDEDGRLFAVINDLVNNTSTDKLNEGLPLSVEINKTNQYTKDFLKVLFKYDDEAQARSKVSLNYIIDILIRNYINKLNQELDFNNIQFRCISIDGIQLSFEDLEYKGMNKHLACLI